MVFYNSNHRAVRKVTFDSLLCGKEWGLRHRSCTDKLSSSKVLRLLIDFMCLGKQLNNIQRQKFTGEFSLRMG